RHRVPVRFFSDDDTIEGAAFELAQLAEEHQTRAVLLIDSVQTVTCRAIAELDEEPTDYVKVTRNVRAIRAVTTKYKLITISTSEMNRAAYAGIRKSDHMGSGKQSGAIEYSARVMLSWEPDVTEAGKVIPDRFRVTIEKNKHGPRGETFWVELDRPR